ncbi:diphthine methyltransferase-like [Varroa jacobsoni]|uniref:diphthine methyltransferase-like n=1 Tax=Varroa jacobsoni TaxID=62625 RepID=UPI000BF9C0F9|nr:diphthine methyltransferase-like [Varroa jacobsoni]
MAILLDRLRMHANCDTIAMCSDCKRFLVGTYELQDRAEQIRLGSLSLFTSNGNKFQLVTTCEAPAGVLDVKFRKDQPVMIDDGNECFAAALADGTIRLGYVTHDNQVKIQDKATLGLQQSNNKSLALSVSWSPVSLSNLEPNIAATFSSGILHEYKLTNVASSLVFIKEHAVSQLEIWAVLHNGQVIYTGGDDSKLRQTTTSDGGSRVIRRFESGVTTIEADPWNEGHLLVGTYEDKLYQFDLRMIQNSIQEVHTGGGVWRIKTNPTQSRLLAVAAMHAGAFVVDCHKETWSIKQHFTGHESMCYGIDWWDGRTVLSCSFYDRELAMWKLEEQ